MAALKSSIRGKSIEKGRVPYSLCHFFLSNKPYRYVGIADKGESTLTKARALAK